MTNTHHLQILIYILIMGVFYPLSAQSNTVADNLEPQQIILSMTQQFENELSLHQKDITDKPSITEELIIQHLIPNVNFLLMSRYVLGKKLEKSNGSAT